MTNHLLSLLEAVLTACTLHIERVETDYNLLDKEHRKSRKAVSTLQSMLAAEKAKDPRAAEIQEVVEHYAYSLGHHRIKVVLTDKRADTVRKAFSWGYTVAELKLAIDGLACRPYVWPNRGRMPYGVKAQRHDKLETVLGDTASIERFQAFATASEPDERLVMVPARVLDKLHARDAVMRAEIDSFRVREEALQLSLEALAARVEGFEGSPDAPKLRLTTVAA